METETISGWRAVELLWPLNDMFRARLPEIRRLAYDPAFEPEADAAIEAYADAPEAGTWKNLSLGAWRVLLERHQQALAVAALYEAQGRPVMTVPAGFSEDVLRVGLMLDGLLRMKLPRPPADRSRLQLPPEPPGRPARGH
ncbi:MAG: hypothetical protein AB1578_21710 [Thermodesulfobacteriota bacterium]